MELGSRGTFHVGFDYISIIKSELAETRKNLQHISEQRQSELKTQ